MPAMVVVGLQWGDEGKGKATDLLAAGVSYVVRYQGGDNAGHTIVLGDEVFKLHLVPSGVFDPRITPVIGNGVVVNPARLIEEMDALTARGVDVSRLRVSNAAHVILPHHLALDAALEGDRTGGELGTTNRGIGPAYADRALRVGLRMGDLADAAAGARPARAQRAAGQRHPARPLRAGGLRDRAPRGARGGLGRSGSRRTSPRRRPCCTPRSRPASACCWKAPRAPCWTWTRAPTRTSPAPTRWPAAPPPAAASGRARSTGSWGS